MAMKHIKNTNTRTRFPEDKDLHTVSLEKDSCGTGFVVNMYKKPSRQLVKDALTMLRNMDHRSARGAETQTGDGVGIMLSLPHRFLKKTCAEHKIDLPEPGDYVAGNIFLSTDSEERERLKQGFHKRAKDCGLTLLGWRRLVVDNGKLGKTAQESEPVTEQVYLVKSDEKETFLAPQIAELSLLQRAYLLSKYAQKGMKEKDFYICSLSPYTIVYKGMLTTSQLEHYYDDLQNDDLDAHLALVHSRFSTNTFPSWNRAQPFRMMSHNGEINTLLGNQNKMYARQQVMESTVFGSLLEKIYPVIEDDTSDSGAFDNSLEFLYMNDFPLDKILCMMIPEAWQHDEAMSEKRKTMYQAFSCVMEPWDGPACITFADDRFVGAVIDRNGLRPSRYYVTDDGQVIMASEFGVVEIEPKRVVKKDRLEPGKVFLIDTEEHRIITNDEIKSRLENNEDYPAWIKKQQVSLDDLPASVIPPLEQEEIERRALNYGYSEEDKLFLLKPMVELAKDPIGSMGNDVALACLSEQPRLLYDYFKQWFAQVTNPPIDSIRERVIMSIGSYIGKENNLLENSEEQCNRLWLDHPILDHEQFSKISSLDHKGWTSQTLDITYSSEREDKDLRDVMEELKQKAEEAAQNGHRFLILSDRKLSKQRLACSTLMAVSSIHHHLIAKKLRSSVALVIDSAEPREVHHFCALLGYGADAIFPYLALELLSVLQKQGIIDTQYSKKELVQRYKKAVEYGICKVIAKMGISTIDSYKGSQIFEAVGLGKDLIDLCFRGTISRIGGLGFEEVAREYRMLHAKGYAESIDNNVIGSQIINMGNFQWREEGLVHMWSPEAIALLQHAVRANDSSVFQKFSSYQNQRSQEQATIRGLFALKEDKGIPLEEVEAASSLVKRFVTGAMSYGSISKQAHETLAIAMNRIGGKSNTGEGGELAERYKVLENGDSKRSAIKQVASGRFGVTIEYLTNSDEIQIKMAQGAKPGEGGELPGKKVLPLIAKTRHSMPGIGLVSPPPHHDIYSIEDLAQLIYDLKNANPQARISVKLVSKAGVGVIAAGVVKGKADHILISGHDGGTGASPLTSIKHAGLPWELGIAETHQVLVRNGLRSRVILQTDGQLKTGRDIAVAAILGAEEFGFATSALIAVGCIMMRKCEHNTCPVGVATHDEKLVKKFTGKPEHVERMMLFMAEDLRQEMARLGVRKLVDLVGRTDLLSLDSTVLNWKSKSLDLEPLLGKKIGEEESLCQSCSIGQDHNLEKVLDRTICTDVVEAIEKKEKIEKQYRIQNTNRSVGTMVSHHVAKKHGLKGLDDDTITLRLYGHAGQSFGAFLAHGITLSLSGDANDYVGKGLSGGILEIVPPKKRGFVAEDNIIVGNVVLYGAIMGKVFVNGRAAERFCIRNSGVHAVVEGVGAHACEYMTGGRVLVLGSVGRNFCSGMSGGLVYVWDKDKTAELHLHNPLAKIYETTENDLKEIKNMLAEHHARTNSVRAGHILHNWTVETRNFIKVGTEEYVSIIEQKREFFSQEGSEGRVVNG